MTIKIINADVMHGLAQLDDESVHCCVTSPPYWRLRDYGTARWDGGDPLCHHRSKTRKSACPCGAVCIDYQIGIEETPEEFVATLVEVFRKVRRVLRKDGTLWLNLGDSYGKGKQLLGLPWRVAFALQADGWHLRQEIIWAKPNAMPESVRDRCTKAHEHIFLLSKSERYFYDFEAIFEAVSAPSQLTRTSKNGQGNGQLNKSGRFGTPNHKGRNKRSVWTVATQPFRGAHFATFPPRLIEPCILAGCPYNGTVLDPFGGAGTVALVANRHKRNAVLIELNPEYAAMAEDRIRKDGGLFSSAEAT